MEIFSITVQLKLQGAQVGLTYKSAKAMEDARVVLTSDDENIGLPLELVDDFGATLNINSADIMFVRACSIMEDMRRNAEHQYEQAHANQRLQRKMQADPLLTPTQRGGLVGSTGAGGANQ